VTASAVFVLTRNDAEITLGRLRCEWLDLGVVDAIARLHVVAKRLGCSLQLRDASDELLGLLYLAGLDDLFGQPRRQSERCEELGFEEVVDLDDPTA
jgi:hypothetical protein